uniref:NADH dehydrogenase subunit 6 n=1 Tax=Optediceros marginatum TaxID=3128126 RepID=UPI0030E3E225
MTSLILMALSFSSIFLLPLMAQPLSLGLVIMVLSLLFCCLTGMLLSSWYAYILFLIYVGGLLVMFAYVAALSPNMMFLGLNAVLVSVAIFIPCLVFLYNYTFLDLVNISDLNFWLEAKSIKNYGIELVSPYYVSILIALGIILLVNLVVVVKICFYQQSSLRPFKN